ncbi:hypothetical protein ACS5PN_02150 [Roseateles sp. NT4]|uniref:hypothetical protein n=1 Tax=Roseateles sp. NT4 TaxID=3453715 RepID=UPI003EF06464
MSQQIPTDFEAAKPHLRPLLRGRWHVEVPRLRAQIEGASYDGHLASMPFSQDAVVLLGYDLPERTEHIAPEHLAAWGISFQQGLKVAIANLRALSEPKFHTLKSGARVSDWPDGYDASRILLPEVMRQCGIDGDLIMMVPSRRAGILVASASSLEAQLWMLGCSRQLIEEQGGLISAAMFRYQDRRVTSYQPSDPHLASKLGELQKVAAHALYGEQKEALQALHAKQGKDIFVASYKVVERPGSWLSACSWTKGITSLLPKTDLVNMVVVDPTGGDRHQVKILEWETARQLAGERLREVDAFPPRYLVSEFPPDEALASVPAAKL